MQSVTDVRFDRPFHIVSSSPRALYAIYQLDQPLAPGEKLNLTFNVGYTSRGFQRRQRAAEFAYSGTFFDSSYFPTIGYDTNIELDDPRRRREEHLPRTGTVAPARRPSWRTHQPFHAALPTGSPTTPRSAPRTIRSPLRPGYLTRDWHANGRHYFTLRHGRRQDPRLLRLCFRALRGQARDVSGRRRIPIAIEVYHDARAHLRRRRYDRRIQSRA